MSKTGAGLARYAAAQVGRPYWWGTFGQTATPALLAQKRRQYPENYASGDFETQYGCRVHDCVGLVKGYLWSDTPHSAPKYIAAQDVAVNGLYLVCREHGSIGTIPEEPGVCVFMENFSHVGVYIGGGEVVEAMGHAYGVVKTQLKGRGWAYWGKPRWIEYTGGAETSASSGQTPAVSGLPELSFGAKGEYVRSAQLLLIGRGYDCGGCGADGEIGQDTFNAAVAYQRACGLQQDGIIGAQTWARLIGG